MVINLEQFESYLFYFIYLNLKLFNLEHFLFHIVKINTDYRIQITDKMNTEYRHTLNNLIQNCLSIKASELKWQIAVLNYIF